jgi:phosphatidylserine/phosphatidylglycerophosphate/cardiolipin synthase-like enzyme
MPVLVLKTTAGTAAPQALDDTTDVSHFIPEMVGRNCRLQDYDAKSYKPVDVTGEVIAYTSPESTYAATRRLFDQARSTILIGIYDFSAAHMRELLLAAMSRGVKVSLMLDIDNDSEQTFFDDLVEMGVVGVPAPSCANDVTTLRFFSSSHEKVIVIDNEWVLVQSGNYSDNSIPLNVVDGGDPASFRFGNRDTGLAFNSKPLAKLFAKILKADMKLVTATPQMLAARAPAAAFLIEKAPTKMPARLHPSKTVTFKKPVAVTPIVSPDNYMDVMPDLLRSATKSIFIEQQYIRAKQPNIRILLQAMADARDANPGLDIKIVLGKVFNASDLVKERANLDILAADFKLKLGTHIRYVNTEQLVHCHNKMIIVDGNAMLISSQNWSDSAVTKNREAGVWLRHKGLATYFTSIFDTDWRAAFKTPEKGVSGVTGAPEALAAGGFVRVEAADYAEV